MKISRKFEAWVATIQGVVEAECNLWSSGNFIFGRDLIEIPGKPAACKFSDVDGLSVLLGCYLRYCGSGGRVEACRRQRSSLQL